MIWFIVAFIHGAANCPGKCEPVPSLTIQMPSQDVCVQVKQLNADQPLECWAKPGPGAPK